jgi:hypothetical protein
VSGLGPAAGDATFITIDSNAVDGWVVYTLDPRRRIARYQSRGTLGYLFNGGSSFAIPLETSQFGFRAYLLLAAIPPRPSRI